MHVRCIFTLSVAVAHAKHSTQNVQIASTGNVLKSPAGRPILSGDTPFVLEDPKELPTGLPAGADTPFELDDKALAAVQQEQGDETSPFVVEGRHYIPASAAAMRENDSPFVVEGAPKDGPPDKDGNAKFVADNTAAPVAGAPALGARVPSAPSGSQDLVLPSTGRKYDSPEKPFSLDDPTAAPISDDVSQETLAPKHHHFVRNDSPGPHVAQPHTTQLVAMPTTEEPLTTRTRTTSPLLSFELGAAILEKDAGARYVEIPGTPFEMESGLVAKRHPGHQFRRRSVELMRGPHDLQRIPEGSSLLQTLEKPDGAEAAAAPVLPSMAPTLSPLSPSASTMAVNPATVAAAAPLLTAMPATPLSVAPLANRVQTAAAAQPPAAAQSASPLAEPSVSAAAPQQMAAAQAPAASPAVNRTAPAAGEQVLTAASALPAAATPTAAPAASQVLTAAAAAAAAAAPATAAASAAAAPLKSIASAAPPATAAPAGVQELATMSAAAHASAAAAQAGSPLGAGSLNSASVTAPPAIVATAPAAGLGPPGQAAQEKEAAAADQEAQAAQAAMSASKKMMRSEVAPAHGMDAETAVLGGHSSRVRSSSRLAEAQLSPLGELSARELFHSQAAEPDVPPLGPMTLPFAASVPQTASQQAPQLNQPVQMQQAQPVAMEANALSVTGSAAHAEASQVASSADAAAAQAAPAPAATAAVANTATGVATGGAHQAASTEGASVTAAAESSTSQKSDAKPALLPAPPMGANESAGVAVDVNKTVPLLTSTESNTNTTNSSLAREPAKAVTTRGAIISMLLGLFVTLFFLTVVMVMLHLGRKPDSIDVPEKEPPRPTRSYRQMFKAQKAEAAQPPTSSQPSV